MEFITQFFQQYWTLLAMCLLVFTVVGLFIYKAPVSIKSHFYKSLRQWLVYACLQAERALGDNTGQAKLRYVYDLFIQRYPLLKYTISFNTFSMLVDEALVIMNKMLEDNEEISFHVRGLFANKKNNG